MLESMESSSMSNEGVDRLRDESGNVMAMGFDVMESTDTDVDGGGDVFAWFERGIMALSSRVMGGSEVGEVGASAAES